MKFKFTTLTIAAAALSLSSAQAIININVSGGQGTPLTIEIAGGDTFTASTNGSGGMFMVFQNFWDNTVPSTSVNSTVSEFSLNGSNTAISTGAANVPGVTPADLIVGFGSVPAFANGASLVLTTGTRITASNLSLDYTTDGPVAGNVFIATGTGTILSDTLTYSGTVPEPSAYAALAGLATLGVVAYRRRRA